MLKRLPLLSIPFQVEVIMKLCLVVLTLPPTQAEQAAEVETEMETEMEMEMGIKNLLIALPKTVKMAKKVYVASV